MQPSEADIAELVKLADLLEIKELTLSVDPVLSQCEAQRDLIVASYAKFGFTSRNADLELQRIRDASRVIWNSVNRSCCSLCYKDLTCGSDIGASCISTYGCAGVLVTPFEATLLRSRSKGMSPQIGVLSGYSIDDFSSEYCNIWDENGVVLTLRRCDKALIWLEEIKAFCTGYKFGELALRRFCTWLDRDDLEAGLRIGYIGTPPEVLHGLYERYGFFGVQGRDYLRKSRSDTGKAANKEMTNVSRAEAIRELTET